MTPGARLRQLQRQLYEANERRIRQHVTTPRRFDRLDLDNYERELEESVPKDFEISSPSALRAAIRRARIVLVGDYHTLPQSQRGFIRVLRASRARHVIIALEFVMARHQRAVDAYMAGRIDEATFLRRIEYKKAWPSYQVWPNFHPIFKHARARGARILALDCDPNECTTVFSRDAFMAWRLAEELRETPQAKAFVLVGESHLAPSHLPLELSRALARIGVSGSILTIHQHLDSVYFALADRGVEDSVDVVRLAPDRFVVPVSTPVAAQVSFLQAVTGEGPEASHAMVRSDFAGYVRMLGRLIGINTKGLLRGLTICVPGAMEPMATLAERMDPESWRTLVSLMTSAESVCLPEYGVVYLASLSATHMAEEAAHFLKARLAGGPTPDDPCDFFYSRILHEAVGYFGAKVFNPKRKPPYHVTVRRGEGASQREEVSPDVAVAVHLAGLHRKLQRRRRFDRTSFDAALRGQYGLPAGLAELGPEVMRPLVHLIGYELGERVYLAFRSGKLKVHDIRRLFLTNFEEGGRAFEVFRALAMAVRSTRLPAHF